MRFFIDLSYCGTRFNGWQNQDVKTNARNVQTVIETALTTLTREKHDIVGCGRTDTGVHAKHFIAHTDSKIRLDSPVFLSKLNRYLPDDIVIHGIKPVSETAHARFDAVSRSYIYYLHTEKSAFPKLSFLYSYKKPNLDTLNKAASLLLGQDDFYTFCKTKTDVKTTRCNITDARWYQRDETNYEFHITGDRFLRGMVRLIVGMCLDIDRGKLTIPQVQEALQSKKRLPRHWSVPAIGLFLHSVQYADNFTKK